MDIEVRKDANRKEIEQALEEVYDGIRALQSTDDLGSEEANQRAWDDMVELGERAKALEKRLKEG